MSELATTGGGELARVQDVNVSELLSKIVASGMTADAAGAVKELVLLQEHQQDRWAKQDFIKAFGRVKAKCRKINASRMNPAKDGSARWWMASLIDLQDEIEPILREEEMELSFDTRRDGPTLNMCVGICIIMHIPSGHIEKREVAVNAANAQGGDLGAATTAKRGALIAMLALRIEHDDDARMLGDVANPEQVATLQARLRQVRPYDYAVAERKFLAFAQASDWKNIRQGKLGQLHEFLNQAEKAMHKPTTPANSPQTASEPSVDEQADILRREREEMGRK